jgi:hypothetical protein
LAQQTLLGGDGTTGESGATHNSKANSNFTELYAATAAAQADADAANTAISDHISDGTAAHAGTAIAFTPVGTITATNVQDAIAEVATEAGASVPDATDTVKGIVELATNAETITGTDTTKAITPANLLAARPKVIQLAASDETTAITATTNKIKFRMPYAMTLTAVRASLTTAQASGSIFTVDINENGTTVLSTKLTIDNTEKTSTTAAAAAVISDASLADDSEISIDVDQIGDGTATGLKITLIGS